MRKYIGVKMVEAEPMTLGEYNKFRGWTIPVNEDPEREGYKTVYPDGYVSWSPKEAFEKYYMQVGDNNTITNDNVNGFVKEYEGSTWGDKTSVVHATLANGFIMSESSSCVDPANYNLEIGCSICKERIINRIWGNLGFVLQWAIKGIK